MMQPHRSTLPGNDRFALLLRSEWAKLTSLRSTAWCLVIAAILSIGLSALVASSSKFYGELPEPMDSFSFVYRPMSGDGSVTARLAAQDPSHAWAKAGVMIKESLSSGSRYASIMVTPDHGLRMEANFTTDIAGPPVDAPHWIRLTRSGDSITGYESADGTAWRPVGAVTLDGLPAALQIGVFVTSPFTLDYVQGGGAQGIAMTPTVGRAVFDHLDTGADTAGWTYRRVTPTAQPGQPQLRPGPGGMTQDGGTITVTGDGDIAWYGIPSYARPDARDVVSDSLQGVQIGLLAMLVLGVLAASGEYKTGMIRTTLAAGPRRGRLLAAKAVVAGGIAFVTGLVASAAAFLTAQPILRARGVRPPAYPYRSLMDADVLRAVIGTAAALALFAVFALALGMLLRRSSRAIPIVIAVVMVPQLLGPLLNLNADKWLSRLTPAAGLAIQQTIERFDTAIGPWPGLGVLAAYSAGALWLALWMLRRRNA